MDISAFAPWIDRWCLQPDGEPLITPYALSRLLPVRTERRPAMLKLGASADERRGGSVMAWWHGQGAAPVLAHDDIAILMLRAEGGGSLVAMAMDGRDDEATVTICDTVGRLHRARGPAPAGLPPLEDLFLSLGGASEPRLAGPAAAAGALLADPRDAVVLHGDIHHNNILDFGAAGWLAIDPWGYVGDRAFDYANILRNPDLERVIAPGRLERHIGLIATNAKLDPARFRLWVYAHAGLAAAWDLAEGHDPARSLAVIDIIEGA